MTPVLNNSNSRATRLAGRKDQGFTLVMTLLLLVVVAASSLSMVRSSLNQALRAQSAQTDLQRRWGMWSCQAALLPNIEAVLIDSQEQSESTFASKTLTLPLSGHTYEVVLGDEQAKVNINHLYSRRGRVQCDKAVRSLTSPETLVPIQLSPARAGQRSGNVDATTSFFGFDQIIVGNAPSQARAVSKHLTCWGDGRVNIHRAAAQVIATACAPLLTIAQAKTLVRLRTDYPGMSAAKLLAELDVRGIKAGRLLSMLTDQSACHSLWVTVQTEKRQWHAFTVLEKALASEKDIRRVLIW